MDGERCCSCFYPLDETLQDFIFCELCQCAKLCTRCAIMEDLAICPLCKDVEIKAADHAESVKKTLQSCVNCQIVWGILPCKKCSKVYCKKCSGNSLIHSCWKCDSPGCATLYGYLCCRRYLCATCYFRHERTDCEETMFYTCHKCNNKVLTFGPDQDKCPVLDCILRYGCKSYKCYVSPWNGTFRGTYCENHKSNTLCPGCKSLYPLDPALGYGYVRITVLWGSSSRKREYCGTCLQKIKALTEGILMILLRMKKLPGGSNGFPKVMMDKIVFLALDLLR